MKRGKGEKSLLGVSVKMEGIQETAYMCITVWHALGAHEKVRFMIITLGK